MTHLSRSFLTMLALFLASCAIFQTQSQVKSGQLFQPGVAAYNDYFKQVHDLQVAAAGWDAEKAAARRPLVDALKLPPEAADVTIVQAAHERMVAVAHMVGSTKMSIRGEDPKVNVESRGRLDDAGKEIVKALESTAKAEMARTKALRDVPPKVDALDKTGRELEPKVRDDFAGHGGSAVANVHDELVASYDVLSKLSTDSRSQAREAEDFVADLQRAVSADSSEPLLGEPQGRPAPHPHPHPHPHPQGGSKPKPKPAGGGGGGGGGGDDFVP